MKLKNIEAAKKNKKQLMVGMNMRFRPDFMMQESFISNGALGEVFYVKVGFTKKRSTVEKWVLDKKLSGGGVIMDLGIVVLDMALWILKFPKIKSVSAVNYYHNFKSWKIHAAFIKFINGVTKSRQADASQGNDIFYCNVFEPKAVQALIRGYIKDARTFVNVTPLKLEKPANILSVHEYELQHFFNSLHRTKVIANGEEAVQRQGSLMQFINCQQERNIFK
jgi:predicted dehydrogenase